MKIVKTTRPGLLGLLAIAVAATVACARSTASTPTRDDLVGAHLEGGYDQVLAWCPVYLGTPSSSPNGASWCLYGLPAALWLSHARDEAFDMIRVVCSDLLTGRLRGDDEFRSHYASEVSRWFALSLLAQRREAVLAQSRTMVIRELSEMCAVEPRVVAQAFDGARIGSSSRRGAR